MQFDACFFIELIFFIVDTKPDDEKKNEKEHGLTFKVFDRFFRRLVTFAWHKAMCLHEVYSKKTLSPLKDSVCMCITFLEMRSPQRQVKAYV